MIKRAKNDGYVPLQVFVSIMDAISPGSGTQAVYLKLDLSSLKQAKSTSEFKTNDKNTQSSSSTLAGNTSSAGSHEKVTIQSSQLPKTEEPSNAVSSTENGNVQGQIVTAQNSDGQTEPLSTNTVVQTQQEEEEETPIVVPSIMSVLVSLAGIFYKVKSRGL